MNKYIKEFNRRQRSFLPDCIDDYISSDNPVRIIDAFVDSLDMCQEGFQRPVPNSTGSPSYDPRDLLKLYIYGYFNKISSSRKLVTECTRNIELFFLLNKLTPDFKTISDFRKDNRKAIKNIFSCFDMVCMKLHLYNRKTDYLNDMDEEDNNQQDDDKYTEEKINAIIKVLKKREE